MEDKLCLQWNDFKDNLGSSFGELRGDKDLTDVTLACGDGKQVEAHKVILASSSPFFMDMLKRNKQHPHHLIYMRGLKSEDLAAIVDFLYFGETNVFQENLDSFLALAGELQLKGLTGTGNSTDEAEEPLKDPTFRNNPVKKEKSEEQKKTSNLGQRISTKVAVPTNQISTNPSNQISTNPTNKISTNLQDLDEQIKSMMTIADQRTSDGHKLATCNICGKEAASNNMPSHIEANHITGVSHSCDLCGKVSRSRDALRKHKNLYH